MKKVFFIGLGILFANIGFSQFLTTGTVTTDNKFRSGAIGLGYSSAPSFGVNKFMVNGQSSFNGNINLPSGILTIGNITNPSSAFGIRSDKPFLIVNSTYPSLEIISTATFPYSLLNLSVAHIDYAFSNVSKAGDVVLRGYTTGSMIFNCENGGNIKFTTTAGLQTNTVSKVQMSIDKFGKVGIGTEENPIPITASGVDVSNYKLFVKGGILTEEVRVSLANTWADYVFEEDYVLKPLNEVEQFINDNGHLPNVPSAEQVKEEGIELGEMAKIQQEKIEELTLYIIEQNKINEKQSREIEELKKLVTELLNNK